MLLRGVHFIADPARHLVDAHTRLDQQAGKGLAHHVRPHPRQSLRPHVFHERALKIVAVAPLALADVRLEGEGSRLAANQVPPQELAKFPGQRHGAVVAVLDPERIRVLDVAVAAVRQVEPVRAGFHDFTAAHPAEESAVEHEAQIVVRGRRQQPVAFFPGAEGGPCQLWNVAKLDLLEGADHQAAAFYQVAEEGLQHAHPELCAAFLELALQMRVVSTRRDGRYLRRLDEVANVSGELNQRFAVNPDGVAAPFARLAPLGNKLVDLGPEAVGIRDGSFQATANLDRAGKRGGRSKKVRSVTGCRVTQWRLPFFWKESQ